MTDPGQRLETTTTRHSKLTHWWLIYFKHICKMYSNIHQVIWSFVSFNWLHFLSNFKWDWRPLYLVHLQVSLVEIWQVKLLERHSCTTYKSHQIHLNFSLLVKLCNYLLIITVEMFMAMKEFNYCDVTAIFLHF